MKSDFTQGFTTQLLKVMRIAYTQAPDMAALTANVSPILLSSRLFVPERLSPRTAETTSQTVERMNAWLQLTSKERMVYSGTLW